MNLEKIVKTYTRPDGVVKTLAKFYMRPSGAGGQAGLSAQNRPQILVRKKGFKFVRYLGEEDGHRSS